MVRGIQFRALMLGTAMVSLAVLTGCAHTQQKTVAQVSPQQRIEDSKKTSAEKAKEIAALQDQKKVLAHQSDDAKKKLSILMAQSDVAFRTAQQYKNQAAGEKNPVKKQQLKGYADKAQQTANDLSQQLMQTNVLVYDALAKVRDIDSKIADATTAKKQADQIATGTPAPSPVKQVAAKTSTKPTAKKM